MQKIVSAFLVACLAQNLAASVAGGARMLTNTEGDNKPIELNTTQWAVLIGGSLVFFVLIYLLLGTCFKNSDENQAP